MSGQVQRTDIDWEAYKLNIVVGSVTLCTVRIFLMSTQLYMVEFLRGQIGIFQFKRVYESIQANLSDVMKHDHSLQLLNSAAPMANNKYRQPIRIARSRTY